VGEAVTEGKILIGAAPWACAVDARHRPSVAQARCTRRETEDNEGRHEHEVQTGKKDATGGDCPEHAERLRRAREALSGRG